MTMSRRATAATALATAVILILTACGSDDSSSSVVGSQAGNEDVNRTDPAALKEGGEFKWPIDELPSNWNVYQVDGTTASAYHILGAMMPSVFNHKADATVAENRDYIESAQITSSDPQVVTYRLNPKAKWSDGRAFSWEDFDAQVRALSGKEEGYNASASAGYEDISRVEKGTDEREVKVTFERKFADWRTLFNPLYPKSANASTAAFNQSWADEPQATAGPFKIGTIDRTGKFVTVVRDDGWWGTRAKLDKITFRVVERPALADALANGAIDFCNIGASLELYERARGIPGVVIRRAETPDYAHLTFNGSPTSILSDAATRTAIMRGVDTKIITKALLGDLVDGEPKSIGNHLFLPGSKYYRDNSAPASFDKDAARSELDALGWKLQGDFRRKDGRDLAVRFVFPSPSAPNEQTAKLVQSQLKEIGVKVELVAAPSAEFLTKWVFTGNFDITGFRWTAASFPISATKSIYYLTPGNVSQNWGQVGNDTINRLYTEASAELDDDRRADLANKIDEEVWKVGHNLPLYQLPGASAIRSTVANTGSIGYGEYDYANIGFTG